MSNWLIRVVLTALLIGFGAFAQAKEEYHGFVKDQWYLVKGGKEVSPKDFSDNPMRYMRSPAAYTALRDHAAQVVGVPMSDQDFRQLIVSDDVRLVECVGRIKTEGITNTGKIGRHERACYPKERLMQVKVSGGWMNLLSLGCYNPIEGERPPQPRLDPPPPKPADPPPPPPVHTTEAPALQLRCVPVTRRYIVPSSGGFVHVPGLSVEVCQGRVPIPDIIVNIPSSVTVVTREETDYCN